MEKIYEIKCVTTNGDVFNIQRDIEPTIGDTIILVDSSLQAIEVVITKVSKVVTITNCANETNYYVCIVKPIVEPYNSLVGVQQCKFIIGSSYAEMEQELNKFLYENRISLAIIDIQYTTAFISVKYKLRSKKEQELVIEELKGKIKLL